MFKNWTCIDYKDRLVYCLSKKPWRQIIIRKEDNETWVIYVLFTECENLFTRVGQRAFPTAELRKYMEAVEDLCSS